MLMRAYVRLNQPHLAIRQYKTCVRQVRAELDVEPDPETQQLYGLIRRRIAV
jgi:DNA-binding SARP family transcriptional activator